MEAGRRTKPIRPGGPSRGGKVFPGRTGGRCDDKMSGSNVTRLGERHVYMSNPHVKYLLVGGGLASSSAAGAIRELDPDGSLLLVGQEINRPYHRPPLSKEYLRRQLGRAELTTQAVGWFAERGIELRTGRRVAHLDTARQIATQDNGE